MDSLKPPLERAALLAGGQKELAKKLGVRPQTVWWWINRAGGQAPAEKIRAIVDACGGIVKDYELRPDIFRTPENCNQ